MLRDSEVEQALDRILEHGRPWWQLLRLSIGTWAGNLAGGWLATWLVIVSFPDLESPRCAWVGLRDCGATDPRSHWTCEPFTARRLVRQV